jgi:hypothetical protein
MKPWRLVVAALVIIALVVVSFRSTSTSTTAPPPVPCTTATLGRAFSGQVHLSSIQNFGCEGVWAYVWATVGTGEHAIGVTEVLNYSIPRARWSIVSRLADCKASVLPHVIYRQGCFSN